MNPVSRITGEGKAEFLRTWGPGLDQKGAGVGWGRGGGAGGAAQCVRGNYIILNKNISRTNLLLAGGGIGTDTGCAGCRHLEILRSISLIRKTHEFDVLVLHLFTRI